MDKGMKRYLLDTNILIEANSVISDSRAKYLGYP